MNELNPNVAEELKDKATSSVQQETANTTETTKEVVTDKPNDAESGTKTNIKSGDDTTSISDENNSKEGKENDPKKEETKEKPTPTLTHINRDFAYELMSIPTYSKNEYRMVTFIILWARANKIAYEFDDYGNIYLTKGKLRQGEFYPCVTSHLDTVQDKQEPYIHSSANIEILTKNGEKDHEGKTVMYCDGFGIGADDKAGLLISLSLFKHCEKLKAAFFLEEEIGCFGSKHLNKEWFKNVGYVIGFDSPDLNRAAFACSGTLLFDKDFFVTKVKDIVEKHGVEAKNFKSEPFTDVVEIRKQTNLICMNFGNGGYNAHFTTEYCVLEDMDNACRMGADLISHLGTSCYKLTDNGTYSYNNPVFKEVENYFDELNGRKIYNYSTQTTNCSSHTNNSYNNSANTTPTKTVPNEDVVSVETLNYISERYDEYIENVKNVIKENCEKNGIDYDVVVGDIFKNEIVF